MSEDSQQEIAQGDRKHPLPTRYIAGFIIMVVGLCFLVIATVFWSARPAYTELLNGIDHEEAAAIAAELQNNKISFRFEQTNGAISVLSDELQYARVKLAAKGLLYTDDIDRKNHYEVVARKSTSELGIQRSSHHILEIELAKSIASIDYVQSARVHLALANIVDENNSQLSRASVVVRLYPGRRLTETQISSISHLIASSVSNLSFENITIIDQTGKLLKSAGSPNFPNLTAEQFNYATRVEQSYLDRIENILIPILGANAVRSQVAAELEFNYPESSKPQKGDSVNRHFEPGNIQRLSVTVVVNNRLVDSGDGQLTWVARSADEMKRITELVKRAIAYNAKRGDSVNIINEPLNILQNKHNSEKPELWGHLRSVDAKWYLTIGLLVVIGGLFVLRSKRTGIKKVLKPAAGIIETELKDANLDNGQQHTKYADEKASIEKIDEKSPFEQSMLRARQLVREEPKIVAQIVGNWVKEGG